MSDIKELKITDFVTKGKAVRFNRYRAGQFYYRVFSSTNGEQYDFPVPLSELGEATLNKEEQSILMMRYIRIAITDGTMIKV